MKIKKSTAIIVAIILVLSAIYISTHFSWQDLYSKQQTNLPLVTTAHVKQQNVQVTLSEIGNVQAYTSIDVKSLISGEILYVGFDEGDIVKQGQVLFQIDPRPYEVKLLQAKAQLAKDQAQLKNAMTQVDRNKLLLPKGYVSKDLFDQLIATQDALIATVAQDKASVENAKLELSYCTITAPITGKTGDILVDQGNIIQSNNTSLVTINQINPINATFSVPQKYLPLIIKEYEANHQLPVYAKINDIKVGGYLSFINNTVDETTGTIQLKATFPNTESTLWPGQFVKIILPLEKINYALLIPITAVLSGQNGDYVYIIKHKMAYYQAIELGPLVEEGQVIRKGLTINDIVVTHGQAKIADGTEVSINHHS